MMKRLFIYIVLCCAMITFGLQAVNAQGRTMKVICYNILKGMQTDTTQGKQVFSEWMRKQAPDILAIQEANYFTQKSLEELAKSYGHPYAVLLREQGYPTALTSKYPIVNVRKVVDNMWHGFIMAEVNGYNILVLHLSPHKYWKRQQEIVNILEHIRLSGKPNTKWMVMGDTNSVSPLDGYKYADGKYKARLAAAEKKNPKQEHLQDGEVDFSVHQRILDYGFVDALRQCKEFDDKAFNQRIDFIYVSPDLKKKIVRGSFMSDAFTKKYSDHRPIYIDLTDK